MTTITTRETNAFPTRVDATQRRDEWKKRNAQYLKNWNPIRTLRLSRKQRWSSSRVQFIVIQ